jgi:hypothetical protein
MRTPTCQRGVVFVMLGVALTLTGCERAPATRDQKAPTVIWPSKTQSVEPQRAQTPRVVDHPLVHRGRNGHLAGPPVAVAGVRCFRQVPRSGPEGDAWFYCVADVDMNIDEPRTLPPDRTDVRIASATVTVHPVETERHGTDADEQIWTFRRVDVGGATVKVLGTEFLGRFLGPPGHRIGYVMSADGQGGMYGRTVFELRDPATKEYIGAFCVIVTRFP